MSKRPVFGKIEKVQLSKLFPNGNFTDANLKVNCMKTILIVLFLAIVLAFNVVTIHNAENRLLDASIAVSRAKVMLPETGRYFIGGGEFVGLVRFYETDSVIIISKYKTDSFPEINNERFSYLKEEGRIGIFNNRENLE
jgi:hypothetical protein